MVLVLELTQTCNLVYQIRLYVIKHPNIITQTNYVKNGIKNVLPLVLGALSLLVVKIYKQ